MSILHDISQESSQKQNPELRPVQEPPAMRFAVLVPVYNHGGSVGRVVRDIAARFVDSKIIIINDGSTDQTSAALEALMKDMAMGAPRATERIRVITLAKNQGKGAALLAGFKAAHALNATHALTTDADGQHLVSDMDRVMRFSRLFPDDLIIGDRQMDDYPVPPSSKKGRDLSRFWLWIQTGQDVPDSQCGLRVYPLSHTLKLGGHWFKRFDFESETLARHAWAGMSIRSTPITCLYFSAEERITHFRPIRDTLRGVRLNVLLVIRRLLPLPGPKRRAAFCRAAERPAKTPGYVAWHNRHVWKAVVRDLFTANLADARLPTAVGVGLLIGFFPAYGLQTLLAIYVARRIHLNVAVTVLASQISIPPLTPLCILASVEVGSLLLYGHGISPGRVDWRHLTGLRVLKTFLAPVLVGGIVCGLLVGTTGLFITRYFMAMVKDRRKTAFSAIESTALVRQEAAPDGLQPSISPPAEETNEQGL